MIEFVQGDILKDDSEAIVITVNCVEVMRGGIVLQFKNAWPENFKVYEAACKREEVQPGRMFVFYSGYFTMPRFLLLRPKFLSLLAAVLRTDALAKFQRPFFACVGVGASGVR